MDHELRTDSTTRTVAVVIRYATDLDHAVDVLLAEFGFDATFQALAGITDEIRAHQAMWIALAAQSDAPTG
ncbi:hypothetical protein [Euzebya sp.]|uniref:hypothetical protein n=1 Tax=Euzebya sp. TaxID=1971409 RepID=UPI0035173A8A